MTFMDSVRKGWRQLMHSHPVKEERDVLLEELCALYRDEAHDAAQFAAHAERMYYPQFRACLLRIAEEEKAHASWLHRQIRALGGEAPQLTVSPRLGHNSWECLRLDVEREQRSCREFAKQRRPVEGRNPVLAEGLQRLHVEERRHHQELWTMWMKSDPSTPPVSKTSRPELEEQKQEWLERRKSEWFVEERADWEAAGRPFVWEEWKGELEKRWTVNELPSLELIWERRVAEEELAREEQALKKPLTHSEIMTIPAR